MASVFWRPVLTDYRKMLSAQEIAHLNVHPSALGRDRSMLHTGSPSGPGAWIWRNGATLGNCPSRRVAGGKSRIIDPRCARWNLSVRTCSDAANFINWALCSKMRAL